MISRFASLSGLIFFMFFLPVNFAAGGDCAGLKSRSGAGIQITSAEIVPLRTAVTPEGKTQGTAPAPPLPEYCRVEAVLTPSADSHIEMELWLPTETWNGKFQAVGGGGWAGSLSTPAMASALREGYATASNDTGHKGGNALFGIGRPEKVTDYAYRAVHEMTVWSKTLIEAFYGQKPKFSYWNGCSTGGRQGLMEAQRYPDDYDAVIAGAPANYHSRLHVGDIALLAPLMSDDALKVPPSKLELLNKAVLAACDELDGVKDGLLQNPEQCRYDPSVLLCKAGDGTDCLTAGQLETVKRTYAPVRTKTGEIVFPGKSYGSEYSWSMLNSSQPSPVSAGTMILTHQDADWDWKTFDLERDLKLADERTGFINAVDPDLSAFKARGGKLLLYHGWDDTGISPGNTVNYYTQAQSESDPKGNNRMRRFFRFLFRSRGGQSESNDWMRLFMVPGMGHCGGGPGPNQANFISAMERWLESGAAPDKITAHRVSGNRIEMSRPLCPYPQTAKYKGTGSINDDANFECR